MLPGPESPVILPQQDQSGKTFLGGPHTGSTWLWGGREALDKKEKGDMLLMDQPAASTSRQASSGGGRSLPVKQELS